MKVKMKELRRLVNRIRIQNCQVLEIEKRETFFEIERLRICSNYDSEGFLHTYIIPVVKMVDVLTPIDYEFIYDTQGGVYLKDCGQRYSVHRLQREFDILVN